MPEPGPPHDLFPDALWVLLWIVLVVAVILAGVTFDAALFAVR